MGRAIVAHQILVEGTGTAIGTTLQDPLKQQWHDHLRSFASTVVAPSSYDTVFLTTLGSHVGVGRVGTRVKQGKRDLIYLRVLVVDRKAYTDQLQGDFSVLDEVLSTGFCEDPYESRLEDIELTSEQDQKSTQSRQRLRNTVADQGLPCNIYLLVKLAADHKCTSVLVTNKDRVDFAQLLLMSLPSADDRVVPFTTYASGLSVPFRLLVVARANYYDLNLKSSQPDMVAIDLEEERVLIGEKLLDELGSEHLPDAVGVQDYRAWAARSTRMTTHGVQDPMLEKLRAGDYCAAKGVLRKGEQLRRVNDFLQQDVTQFDKELRSFVQQAFDRGLEWSKFQESNDLLESATVDHKLYTSLLAKALSMSDETLNRWLESDPTGVLRFIDSIEETGDHGRHKALRFALRVYRQFPSLVGTVIGRLVTSSISARDEVFADKLTELRLHTLESPHIESILDGFYHNWLDALSLADKASNLEEIGRYFEDVLQKLCRGCAEDPLAKNADLIVAVLTQYFESVINCLKERRRIKEVYMRGRSRTELQAVHSEFVRILRYALDTYSLLADKRSLLADKRTMSPWQHPRKVFTDACRIWGQLGWFDWSAPDDRYGWERWKHIDDLVEQFAQEYNIYIEGPSRILRKMEDVIAKNVSRRWIGKDLEYARTRVKRRFVRALLATLGRNSYTVDWNQLFAHIKEGYSSNSSV